MFGTFRGSRPFRHLACGNFTGKYLTFIQATRNIACATTIERSKNHVGYVRYYTMVQVDPKCMSIKVRDFSTFTTNFGAEYIPNMQKYVQKYSVSNKQQTESVNMASKGTTSDQEWGPYILSRIHTLEESSRFHGYNMLRWGLLGIMMLCSGVYLFRDELRDNMADEVADVASRSMADENVVLKAHEMTKGVLERLVSEPETITLVTDFIQEVMGRDSLRATAVDFAVSVINHPDTQEKIQDIARNTIQGILNSKETKELLLNFIKDLINDDQTKEACQQLLINLTKDHDIQQIVSNFFQSVLASPQFQTEAAILGRQVTNQVVNDQQIQKNTGDALWSAVKYGITPSWFRGS